jgi:hypothetical protein
LYTFTHIELADFNFSKYLRNKPRENMNMTTEAVRELLTQIKDYLDGRIPSPVLAEWARNFSASFPELLDAALDVAPLCFFLEKIYTEAPSGYNPVESEFRKIVDRILKALTGEETWYESLDYRLSSAARQRGGETLLSRIQAAAGMKDLNLSEGYDVRFTIAISGETISVPIATISRTQ